ncbi:heat shock 70 kDa protein 12A [Aplysia californica]|uniref:Heat shock 70 kDa protein 12A n=1 Tax=Aplysia californica TaxID=6500 RepID=A0ABM1AFK8_APLCA|nr:heat shock 70 kDa protein 12A [Aplysia californica]
MAEASTPTKKSSPSKKRASKISSSSTSSDQATPPATDAGMTMASSRIDTEGEEAADYQIVAAIDFGTTFSGYAYSFASNKAAIHVNKNWGQTQGFLLHKTPTCLLLKSDGQFEAFGFEAVSKYNELSEEEACTYYYFDRFKMKLYNNKELTSDISITDANGKSQLAVDVFANSLTFMKKHLLRAIGTHLGYDPHPDTVRWVLTVPAIWDENAKQFMREAAHKGGLIEKPNSEQLVIALEPEAASLHCRNLPATDFVGYKDSGSATPSFEPGTKYLVVDAGGGTIDVVAHKIRKDGRIRELFRATGGAWGGTVIDRQFQNLLESIFGKEFIETFQKEYPKDFVELLQDFEIKKRGECDSIRVSLPYNFCNFKHNGVSVQQAIKTFSSEIGGSDIKFSSGKLVMSSTKVNELFKDALDQINDHVASLLQRPKCKDLQHIFLVGGFAESTRLQSSLREKFGERVTILVPEEASLSVVKGAVAFGHDPSAICQRICRFTYGVGSYLPFEEGVHRDDLRVNSDGMDLCKHIFQTWAEAGEVIGYNEIWRETYTPIINNQRGIIFEFFRSSNKKVQYTDEEGVEKCGFLVVEMPDPTGDRERAVDLEVTFGGTEIKVVGYDHTSTTRHETYIDFLST